MERSLVESDDLRKRQCSGVWGWGVDTLPGEAAVKTFPSKAVGVGLTPGGGAKIPYMPLSQK